MSSTDPQTLTIKINGTSKQCALNVRPLDLCTREDVTCTVDGVLCDLSVPLTSDCTLKFFTFADSVGKKVFWHSCAHVLGAAILEHSPSAKVVSGPPTDNGFYYDVAVDTPFTEKDVREIEERARRIIKEGRSFKRVWMDKEALLQFYAHNEFKRFFVERSTIGATNDGGKDGKDCDGKDGKDCDGKDGEVMDDKVSGKVTTDEVTTDEVMTDEVTTGKLNEDNKTNKTKTPTISCSCYELGTFLDFCNGPHVHNTRIIKTFEIVKTGASYFLGDKDRPSLQRLYGAAFPSKTLRDEHFAFIAEAKRRNHRLVGQEYDLFWFSELSPGSAFFVEGTFIYNALINFMRREYRRRNFTEVITPNMYMTKLWETSGHLQNYREDMFVLTVDDAEWALKPMNCPGHCLLYARSVRSFRELPIRMADFGVLHRNELSGTLSGLTRVRRFQQDDAHVFCLLVQVEHEILHNLEFMRHVYAVLGFEFELALSTRPKKYLGDKKDWDTAEEYLRRALRTFGREYTVNEGDGAFYGPKIDVVLLDALKRRHQCATIQLDFQLPARFNLQCKTSEGVERPVMIHRALLGSVERFIGILIEHYGIRLPFWLTPRQVAVVPVSNALSAYAQHVRDVLIDYEVRVYDGELTLSKRVRNAEVDGYAVVLVVGEKERNAGTVMVRKCGRAMSVEMLRERLERAVREYVKDVYAVLQDI
ncbi:Threonyl-tRNA synthetase [Trachipleistophora hominis]|uniref:threonine--tRNA ligase n=1 Tax=Trachipleistophora hominis TaxID=72359 RepID=L7JX77_TRAHO|nr:Threonyl-tRNA synthetase [Trachipleistophora hominis]